MSNFYFVTHAASRDIAFLFFPQELVFFELQTQSIRGVLCDFHAMLPMPGGTKQHFTAAANGCVLDAEYNLDANTVDMSYSGSTAGRGVMFWLAQQVVLPYTQPAYSFHYRGIMQHQRDYYAAVARHQLESFDRDGLVHPEFNPAERRDASIFQHRPPS